ncbi:MAG: hypothetical protein ACYS0G_14255, partial [Planctomycetota bacterium]
MTRRDKTPAQTPPSRPPSIGFADRLQAEAVRALERDGARAIHEPLAEAQAVEAGGDLEHRVVVRARSVSAAASLRDSLRQVRGVTALIMVFVMVVAAVAG